MVVVAGFEVVVVACVKEVVADAEVVAGADVVLLPPDPDRDSDSLEMFFFLSFQKHLL